MFSYCCLPGGEGVWPPQPFTYAYLPGPLLLPPVQTHNFCSRPPWPPAGEWAAPREYHRFYGAGAALAAAPPWWAFPPACAAVLSSAFPSARALGPAPLAAEAESWEPWPEGASLQAELRWGRVERTRGPRLALPRFVRRELRRAYGTYPRTDVRVTQRDGEFLLQAAPRVGDPEYRVERRVQRRPASRESGRSSPAPRRRSAAAPRGGEA